MRGATPRARQTLLERRVHAETTNHQSRTSTRPWGVICTASTSRQSCGYRLVELVLELVLELLPPVPAADDPLTPALVNCARSKSTSEFR
jgi:hypothetical protein